MTTTLLSAVQYLYRLHVYVIMALKSEHTDASLKELGEYGNALLELLKSSPLMAMRKSSYLFVKAHLFFCHLARCVMNNGALSNTDCALMETHHVTTKSDGDLTSHHNRPVQIMLIQKRRLACGIHLRNASRGLHGTSTTDMQFESNRFLGAPIVFPMNETEDVNVLTLNHCAQCKLPFVRALPRLLRNAGIECAPDTELTRFPTISLDHGLYARASDEYRGEARHDFVESLRIDEQDVEYLHWDRLVAFIRVSDKFTGYVGNWAVVEPMHEVCQLTLPPRASDKVKSRVTVARQRLNSRVYDRSDGKDRLGRPYLVLDPYCDSFAIAAAESIVAPCHVIQDFATSDCFYVVDSTLYFR
jgi:hypothetical protein